MHTSIPGAIGTLFGLDMAVKQYIEENVSEKEEKNFCGTKVLIRKVYNKGFAFNSMDSEPDKVKKASVITTAVILMLTLAESFREGHKVNKTALTLLSAGAISNTYDRIVRGKVVDYIGIRSEHKILGDVTANTGSIYHFCGNKRISLNGRIISDDSFCTWCNHYDRCTGIPWMSAPYGDPYVSR